MHQLLHDNHGVRYFAMAIAAIIGMGLIVLGIITLTAEPGQTDTSTIKSKPRPAPKIYSPLTGLETSEDAAKRPVTAIMIENGTEPDVRPQSGLKDAGIVYEAIAEGGITRFLCLYQESRPQLIGPVRSIRPYFVEWASAYDPAIVHVGGSQRARDMMRSDDYGTDLDQFFNGPSFWRVNDRPAPHNVYTDFEHLDKLRTAKGKSSSTFTGFARTDEKKPQTPNVTAISIDISSGSFQVAYTYDAAANAYTRTQGGTPHADRESGQIQPKVVVAIKVPMHIEMEDGYREQIITTGNGPAYIFQNGTRIEGTWERASEKAPLKLLANDRSEIKLVRGQTWISAVPEEREISWQ